MEARQRKEILEKWKAYAPQRWWGDYLDIRFFLLDRLGVLEHQDILDVGCGAGIVASELQSKGNMVIGLEQDFQALTEYNRLFGCLKLNPVAVCGDWNRPMFKSGSFDALVLGWVLYNDETDERKSSTILNLRKLLRPGGRLYFVETNRINPIQGRNSAVFWTIEEAEDFFTSHGFRINHKAGWNPMPTLLSWLPLSILMKVPRKLLLCLYPPGKIIQHIPGWYGLFNFLSKRGSLWKYCRTYFLELEKI